MTLVAFLHGYPPGWSMGGEVSTHRTIRAVPGSVVFTNCDEEYELDGVRVMPLLGTHTEDIKRATASVGGTSLYAHSSLSAPTVRAAKMMGLPSILAVHAPPRFGTDLRRAWSRATVRLYNTEISRKEWNDPMGWLLHPPAGLTQSHLLPDGPRDALTLTSSLLNKGVTEVLELAAKWPDRRFIIVESPAHASHGSPSFLEDATGLPNVEVWPRLHPDEMGRLWSQTRVLLVPSRYETYGMSAVEAAAYGIPSVHVDTPHVREGIGRSARLLSKKRAGDLEQAVEEIEGDFGFWSDAAQDRARELAAREDVELARFARRATALTL